MDMLPHLIIFAKQDETHMNEFRNNDIFMTKITKIVLINIDLM